jgi:hypothetical protein
MTDTFLNQADATQVAAGQLFPEDWANDYAVTAFLIRQALAEMETCTPVQITAVNAGSGSPPAGGTVDVQLLVSLLDGNGNATKQGIVHGLPYFRLQSGMWAICADPAVGDFGFIVCASRDISNVTKTPGMANPGSFRMHSFSDGFFLSCPFSGAAPAATIWLKSDGSLQLTTQDGVVIKSDGSGYLTINDGHSNSIVTASGGITMTDSNGNTVVTASSGITLNANGTKVEANHTTNRCNITATAGLWVNGVQVTVP